VAPGLAELINICGAAATQPTHAHAPRALPARSGAIASSWRCHGAPGPTASSAARSRSRSDRRCAHHSPRRVGARAVARSSRSIRSTRRRRRVRARRGTGKEGSGGRRRAGRECRALRPPARERRARAARAARRDGNGAPVCRWCAAGAEFEARVHTPAATPSRPASEIRPRARASADAARNALAHGRIRGRRSACDCCGARAETRARRERGGAWHVRAQWRARCCSNETASAARDEARAHAHSQPASQPADRQTNARPTRTRRARAPLWRAADPPPRSPRR
jgi:hypothetical protein